MLKSTKFWTKEKSLSSLLVVLVLYHLALPLADGLGFSGPIAAIAFSLIAVSGVLTTFDKPWMRVGVRVAAVAVVCAAVFELANPRYFAAVARVLVDSALVGFLLAAVAAQVFKAGPITAHRLRGSIVVYLLMGVLFGLFYQLIMLFEPSAFKLTGEFGVDDLSQVRRELSYFSFVTLTTVGYGDILPVSPFARAVATFEGLSGQLYLAITIARLVSSQTAAPEDDGVPEPTQER